MRLLKKRRSFRLEFKRQMRYAITSAIGFTVAFAWRNAIFDTFQNFVSRALDVTLGHYLTEIYTALTITICAVAFIFLSAKILRD